MTTLPENMSDAIDELESAIADIESRLESTRAERDEAKGRQVELEIENANLRRELALARERQGAASDILKVIAASTSVQPVFEAIVSSAAKLFAPCAVTITTLKDGKLHWGATAASISGFDVEHARTVYPISFDPERVPSARAMLERRIIEIPDIDAPDTPEITRRVAAAGGFRSITYVPLLDAGLGIGTIIFTSPETGFRFSEGQLAIVRTFADQAVIAIQNARLFNETRDTLERQTATADILKVIASSPSDVQPVFEAIASSAKRLLGGFSATVLHIVGDQLRLVAFTPTSPEADQGLQASFPRRVAEFPIFESMRDGVAIQFPDTEAENVPPTNRDLGRLRGFRSVLFVPLMNQGNRVGILSVTRTEPGAFADHHVQLLQTFADQAVIAIENTRLFNETREALERQTATADILKVIAASPSDVQPVFDAIVHSANRLIGGFSTAAFRYGDSKVLLAAFTPTDAEGDAVLQSSFPLPLEQFPPYHLTREGAPAELQDTETEPAARDIARARGYRSMLFVPLMNDGEAVGIITVTRAAPGPFGEQHRQLLQMFADQAVIAIKNVGLFNEVQARTEELSESLQQQTATADVLKVISRSAFDLETVLDTLTASAASLCGADMAAVTRQHPDGDGYYHATRYNFPPEWDRFSATTRVYPGRGSLVGRVLLEGKTVQIPDVLADPEYAFPEQQKAGGYRTLLGVPLLREGQPIGVLFLGHNTVRPFTDKQIELVQTFADQAVIAIENVRLFDEVQAKTRDLEESLQHQTATADVLKVISRSAFDLEAVLDALLSSACRLCDAGIGTIRYREGGEFRLAATFGCPPEWVEQFKKYTTKPDRSSVFGRTILEGHTVHIPDLLADPDYNRPEAQKLMGFRAALGVPLTREGETFGVINLFRPNVGSFEDKQIELVQTFADQAVIAIENVRLFEEVQAKTRDLSEALTYQTGSANILRVIASSPTDVKPALKAIVESACELCEAYDAAVVLQDGDDLRFSAHHGPIPINLEKWPISRRWVSGRAFVDRTPVHIHDLSDEAHTDLPDGREMALQMGHRTILAVPLLREGGSVGAIVLRRTEVHPFTDKQIALLQTFADQAVIAIGNVRLFEEVQAKTRDLSEALTHQTGSANILRVIASSPTDVEPVLESIVESACELCDANDAVVLLRDGDDLRFSAHHGPIPINVDKWPIGRNWTAGRAFVDRMTVHVPDIFSEEASEFTASRELTERSGLMEIHSVLAVPLLREGESIGVILLRRQEKRPFNEKQIALLQTFADQAVIAIGNVRLFEEVQARTRELSESLEQQTATSEVLSVISRSAGDLAPVFDAMLSKAMQLCGANFGVLNTYDGATFHTAATYGLPPAYDEFRRGRPLEYGPATAPARLLRGEPFVEIADLLESEAYRSGEPNRRALVDLGGAHCLLAVPLLKDGRVVGNVMIFRQENSRFSEKQITLLQQFAAQAVIAIENARLLNELRQRTDDLSQSLDDLRTAQDRLVQTEKLASLGQLTAGIAHEIKNPLNFVNNFAALSAELTEELNDALKRAEIADKLRAEVDELTGLLKTNLEKVVQHGKRADSIVKNMLLHSREGGGEHRPSDINALIDESLNLAYHGARAEKPGFNVTLERDFDPAAGEIDLFPQEITRVILNLVSNGFYAVTKRAKEGGEPGFEPTLRASTKNLGDAVEIRIRDNGTGIPSEVMEKMFNPFFTTKPAGEGTGLGLSMSHDIIVKQHGGAIDVDTQPGHFTEFRIVLPRTSNFER